MLLVRAEEACTRRDCVWIALAASARNAQGMLEQAGVAHPASIPRWARKGSIRGPVVCGLLTVRCRVAPRYEITQASRQVQFCWHDCVWIAPGVGRCGLAWRERVWIALVAIALEQGSIASERYALIPLVMPARNPQSVQMMPCIGVATCAFSGAAARGRPPADWQRASSWHRGACLVPPQSSPIASTWATMQTPRMPLVPVARARTLPRLTVPFRFLHVAFRAGSRAA